MKILVTGGTGFIGSHLAHSLLKNGHEVFILTRQSTDIWRLNDIREQVTLLPYSAQDKLDLLSQYNLDGIIHLATLYKKIDDQKFTSEMVDVNIKLPSILLQHAIKNNLQFFINTGTCFEYKLSDNQLTETSPTEGFNFYAATKLAFEQILQYISTHSTIRTLTLRLFYPYGEKDNRKLIALLMDSFINGKSLKLSKGKQQIDYTYVKDIVAAYSKALVFVTSAKYLHHEVFNIGTEKTITIKEIVQILEQITGKKDIISFGDSYPKGEIMHMNCDYSKAQKLLGWEPKYTMEKGLTHIYNYYKSHPDKL